MKTLLLINPNTSTAVTGLMADVMRPLLGDGVVLEAMTARFSGPSEILLNDDNTTLAQVMERTGLRSPGEAVVTVLETRMPAAILGFGAERDLVELIADPDIAIACDCGAATGNRFHPRAYGTFPRVLGRYVREQRVLSWETAIRKMTGVPAALLGFTDRGLLREGFKADLVVFDSATKRQSVVQSGEAAPTRGASEETPPLRGAEGLPSKMQAVVPPSSTETWKFHMIQPVVLNQCRRSPVSTVGPRLLCRLLFSSTRTMPPWLWTMGLGRPVVPLE